MLHYGQNSKEQLSLLQVWKLQLCTQPERQACPAITVSYQFSILEKS